MHTDDVQYLAFQDELTKISGAGLGRKVIKKIYDTKGENAATAAISRFFHNKTRLGGRGNQVGSARRRYATEMTGAFHEARKSKTAGEMQGATRIGRKPIGIEKMLENENEVTGLPEDFAPTLEVIEVAEQAAKALVKMSMSPKAKHLALLGAGGAAALVGRQAKEDHKLGRMVRKQQEQQGQ